MTTSIHTLSVTLESPLRDDDPFLGAIKEAISMCKHVASVSDEHDYDVLLQASAESKARQKLIEAVYHALDNWDEAQS